MLNEIPFCHEPPVSPRKRKFNELLLNAKGDLIKIMEQGIEPRFANMSWMTLELIWNESDTLFEELLTTGMFLGIPAKINNDCLDFLVIYTLE